MSKEFIEHKPEDIEKKSFEIIRSELPRALDPLEESVTMRVIHTTADFSYIDSLKFSESAIEKALEALKAGCVIVTDTNMVKAGINKSALKELACEVVCYMADEEVAAIAKKNGSTRALASMDKSADLEGPIIYAIGNAPTALKRIHDLHVEGKIQPALVVGTPVGFVNVVEAKELILGSDLNYIVNAGRKGGSNVAAAIINALMYKITRA